MRPVVVLHSRQPRCLSRVALLAMLTLSACTADPTGLDRQADRTTRLNAVALAGTPRVRISQVYGGGGNGGGRGRNDARPASANRGGGGGGGANAARPAGPRAGA